MTDIRIDGLTVSYGETKALDELSLFVPSQSLVAVLGPSGCGKSTLLRAIAGFVAPKSGTIRFGSTLMSVSSVQVPPERRNVGYVPQEGALFPHLSVAKNVGFGLTKGKDSEKRIKEMLSLVGLADLADRMPHQLSGGQQFRVAIARALAPAPNVMLLDEPFASLDAQLREELRHDVKEILKATRTTTLLVTHDREEALVMADLVAPMKNGKIVQLGTPQDVYNNPQGPETAVSTGDALIVPAIKTKSGKIYTALSATQPQSGVSGTVVIRPEEIEIASVKDKANAKVSEIEYFGHDALIHLELANQTRVSARVAAPVNLKVGDKVLAKQKGPLRFFGKN
jgi:iron(III) transport system ATP-binding protein